MTSGHSVYLCVKHYQQADLQGRHARSVFFGLRVGERVAYGLDSEQRVICCVCDAFCRRFDQEIDVHILDNLQVLGQVKESLYHQSNRCRSDAFDRPPCLLVSHVLEFSLKYLDYTIAPYAMFQNHFFGHSLYI